MLIMSESWRQRAANGKPAVGALRKGPGATGSPKPRKLSTATKRYAGARKSGERLLPSMERFLLTLDDERESENLLHVSDLVKNEWCPRALYYRVNGVRPEVEAHSFQLQNIFDYGTESHLKFQRRWRDMGDLWGKWLCKACDATWLGQSPGACPKCGAPKYAIRYREVPLANPALMLVGNADAEIRDKSGIVLVEVKTVGEGTFRVEAPKMLMQYTSKVTWEDGHVENMVDMKQLWKDLSRPLPSHRRQGATYIELRKALPDQPPVDTIVYLYEHKGNQGLKEFVVQADPKAAEEVFKRANDVVWAHKRQQPPRCVEGRGGCKLCQPYEQEARRGNSGNQTRPAAGRPGTRRPVYSGGQRIG